jgi:hypothetical protein
MGHLHKLLPLRKRNVDILKNDPIMPLPLFLIDWLPFKHCLSRLRIHIYELYCPIAFKPV